MRRRFNFRYLYLVPIAIFVLGITYARSVEGFAAIGIAAMSMMISIALLIGIITYHITRKILWSIISMPLAFGILLFLLRMSS